MPDIFNRSTDVFGGAFSADGALITFAGPPGFLPNEAQVGENPAALAQRGAVGLLTQSLNIQYQLNLVRLYEIGTRRTYYVIGRTNGTVAMQRVLGPRRVSISFYRVYGDPCNAARNIVSITLLAGCGAGNQFGGGFYIRLLYLVLTSVSFGTTAQDSLINESVSGTYASLEIHDYQQSGGAKRPSEYSSRLAGSSAVKQATSNQDSPFLVA